MKSTEVSRPSSDIELRQRLSRCLLLDAQDEPPGVSEHQVVFGAHRGCSMNPTLSDRDLLEIAPYTDRQPQVGDVVWFQPSGTEQPVVHRIIAITGDGIRCRGDNNLSPDAWRLSNQDILGHVQAAWRANRRRRIPGGLTGSTWARCLLVRRYLRAIAARCLSAVRRDRRRPSAASR